MDTLYLIDRFLFFIIALPIMCLFAYSCARVGIFRTIEKLLKE